MPHSRGGLWPENLAGICWTSRKAKSAVWAEKILGIMKTFPKNKEEFKMAKTVIIDGARTAFGKFGGALSSFTASDLGAAAIKEALKRSEVNPEDVQEVIMG